MNIRVSDLRRFRKLAVSIKTNKILPIYGYLKFGDGEICKATEHAFVKWGCAESDEKILVEEKHLFNLLDITNAPFINISKKGKKVMLTDGRDNLHFQTDEYDLFTKIPGKPEEVIQITDAFLDALGMSSEFCMPMGPIPQYYMYVQIGNKTICSGDGVILFHQDIEEPVNAILEKDIARLMSREPVKSFSESESHYFFFTEDTTFGFTKQNMGYTDIRKFFANIGKVSFSSSNSDFASYNTLASKSAINPIVNIVTGKMEMYDSGTDMGNTRPMPNITLSKDFSYIPSYMNRLLSAIAGDALDFYENDKFMAIKNPDIKATAIIAKISK